MTTRIAYADIDMELLRQQKAELLRIIWDDKDSILWGLVELIDHIEDEEGAA